MVSLGGAKGAVRSLRLTLWPLRSVFAEGGLDVGFLGNAKTFFSSIERRWQRWAGERVFQCGDGYSRGVAGGGKAALADDAGSDGVRCRGCWDAGGGCAEWSEVGGACTWRGDGCCGRGVACGGEAVGCGDKGDGAGESVATAWGFEPAGACWYTRKRLFDGVVPAEAVWDARLVGAVAQLGERLVRNEEVSGSIPLSSTK